MLGLDNPIHILFLLILLLLVFGAKRLPEMGRSLGSGMRGFKESLSGEDVRSTLTAGTPATTPVTASPAAVAAPAPVQPAASAQEAAPLAPAAVAEPAAVAAAPVLAPVAPVAPVTDTPVDPSTTPNAA